MCCPLLRDSAEFKINKVNIDKNVVYVQGVLDRTSKTFSQRVIRFFQSLEFLEKNAEIFDEGFHLLWPVLQKLCSPLVYQTLRNLHHAAHDVEHFLHAFCSLGDFSRLVTNKFLEYQDSERKKLDYLRSTARICHTVAHFFTTAIFLSELRLVSLGRLEKGFKYASLFSAMGYGIWTISLIWQRNYNQQFQKQFFLSDLKIHFSGLLFESTPLLKKVTALTPYNFLIDKFTALAGIIHAWNVLNRLTPPDREKISGHCPLRQNNNDHSCNGEEHHHH